MRLIEAYVLRRFPPIHPGLTRREWIQRRRRARMISAAGIVVALGVAAGVLVRVL
jgi:hypothetical protein